MSLVRAAGLAAPVALGLVALFVSAEPASAG
jgi:hypothetical protein